MPKGKGGDRANKVFNRFMNIFYVKYFLKKEEYMGQLWKDIRSNYYLFNLIYLF